MNKYGKTLVLDSSFMPRSIINTERAFVISYKGNADMWQWGGTAGNVRQMQETYKQGVAEAQGRKAPTAQTINIDQAQQDQFRQEQMAMLAQLQQLFHCH